MPGPDGLSSGALQWFQAIWSAAAQRMSTADVWSAIRSAAEQQANYLLSAITSAPISPELLAAKANELLSGLSIFDVNIMRQNAGQLISAANALNSAADETAIDASMIGRPLTALTGGPEGLPPLYRARIQYTGIDFEGNAFQDWTSLFLSGEPTTVGDLRGRVLNQLLHQIAAGGGTPPVVVLSSIDQLSLETV